MLNNGLYDRLGSEVFKQFICTVKFCCSDHLMIGLVCKLGPLVNVILLSFFQISSLICVIHIYYDGETAVIMYKGPHSKSSYKNTYL